MSERPLYLVTSDMVDGLIRRILDGQGHIGFDTETTGRDAIDDRICALCVSTGPRHGAFLPWRMRRPGLMGFGEHPREENLSDAAIHGVVDAIRKSGRLVALHGAAFDYSMMRHEGWDPFEKWVDTMIARWLIARGLTPRGAAGATPYSLKACAKRDLGVSQDRLSDVMHPDGFQFTNIPNASKYGGGDARLTQRLWTWCHEQITELDLQYGDNFQYEYDALEVPVVAVVEHMRRAGVLVDQQFLQEAHDTCVAEQAGLVKEIEELVQGPFPISSAAGISKMMFEHLRWWVPQTEKNSLGNYGTGKDILAKIYNEAHRDPRGKRIAWCVLRWRKLDTIRSRYTISLIDNTGSDGRIRCHFAQHGTATGRFSSSGPNLQNIPRPSADKDPRTPDWEKHLPSIRGAFKAAPGNRLVGIDFSQLELRLMAHFSKDPVLVEAYLNDEDVHQITADACDCSRQDAKPINFGLIYGMYFTTLAGQIKTDVRTAERYWRKYFRKYAGVKRFQQRMERDTLRKGYVRTITGRHRIIRDIGHRERWKHRGAVREAVNTTIQGSGADLMKIAMRNVHRLWVDKGVLDSKARIELQVHDELICEVEDTFAEEAAADLKHCFETAAQLRVPLLADPAISPVGGNWLDVK